MNRLIICALCLCLMAACNDQPASGTKESPEEAVAPASGTFCDGVNDQNRGDKSGPVHLTVQMAFMNPSGTMVLYEVEGKFTYPVDSVQVRSGVADFAERTLSRGIYMLELNHDDKNRHPVIINPDEREIVVRMSSPKFEGGFSSQGSLENQGLADYYLKELILERRLLANRKARSKSDQKAQFDALISRDEADLQALRCSTIQAFPGTFLAKWLSWKQDPQHNDKTHFWDNVDFSDASLKRTKVVHERSQVYFQQFGNSNEDGLINCIDDIVARAKANPDVLEATLYAMLEGFSQTKYDGVCTYLLDNYIYGEGCGAPLSDAIKSRAAGIRAVQVGQVPPNIRMKTLEGGTADLYQIVDNHDYTVVVFWASWCKKCQEDAPMLLNLYNAYKNRGLGMLAVSVDKDHGMWEKAVQERGYDWTNVRAPEEWKAPVCIDYHVVKTPVIFLIDRRRHIVLKSAETASEIKAYLDQH
ncbi:MAG: redoxin domain-containing protein, partial [Flavobacteriales bacterium]|nr:redoxin domain-containing protein [Flavobacteriales bacterium]